ncbi:NAD-dependent protein deacetylase sirtuin-3, mitochondrial [Bagarius yarrelli]|uniref:NAD-dependent protein deacetylase sirtuin-3, mitochondrial n=1 Tax=Bagarius yarrelli TaxID=175774 RepID=A0A556TQV2_BAGYA|nr:NAD-dependent protein deacetylase sirtuin-3, mitochondrial [Bagarius yarrelli]
MSRDRRGIQPGFGRVTRSSISSQESTSTSSQQSKPSDSVLLDDLSLMRVSELQATLARKGKASKTGSDVSKSTPGRSVQRGALETVGRLMKLGRLRNVVVVAGAGISTASGIPDFRTPGTGLYANLEKYNVPYPEAVFNIDFFSDDPRPFFSLAKELYPGRHRPNYIHYFIRMLHQKGLLLLCGIPDDKLVEAHGSFATASCHLCYTPFPADEAKAAIMNDDVPTCSFCSATVKPNVVFFGEDLPEKYFQHETDFPKADLLIIMGTSLKIEPFATLVNTIKPGVVRLLLNRHAVGPFERKPLRRGDYVELGDLVDLVRRLAETLGWHEEIQHLMNSSETGDLQSIPMVINDPHTDREQQHRSCSCSNSEESDSSETDNKGI